MNLFYPFNNIKMRAFYCCLGLMVGVLLLHYDNPCKAQTIDELRITISQLEAKNRSLEARLEQLQKGRRRDVGEKDQMIQSLYQENMSLKLELDDIAMAKAQQEAEDSVKKTIPIEIADPVFREYLMRYCDMDNDGLLTQWDAEHTYVIDIANSSMTRKREMVVTNLDGIEFFVNLKRLVCTGNSISNLDLQKNGNLETLVANECNIKILNVATNEKLVHLECSNNLLYTIDLHGAVNLRELDVSRNKIDMIDLSSNVELIKLACNGNGFINLDVSNNTLLESIDCSNNKLVRLSFVNNTSLYQINCSGNSLQELDIRNNRDIEYLDCSKNRELEFVMLSEGKTVASDKKDKKVQYK